MFPLMVHGKDMGMHLELANSWQVRKGGTHVAPHLFRLPFKVAMAVLTDRKMEPFALVRAWEVGRKLYTLVFSRQGGKRPKLKAALEIMVSRVCLELCPVGPVFLPHFRPEPQSPKRQPSSLVSIGTLT